MKLILLFSIFAFVQSQIDVKNIHTIDVLPHWLNNISTKIVGGDIAQLHQFPYQAGIFFIHDVSGDVAFCGGSLITRQYVLTAAHCVHGMSQFTVILGAHDLSASEPHKLQIQTTETKIHPFYCPLHITHDIAVLKLPYEVILSDAIQLVRLPLYQQEESFEDNDATVSGWGKDNDCAQGLSPVLRYVDVPIMDNEICNYYYLGAIHDTHICTSGSCKKSACSGDSGGPLVIKDVDGNFTQVGIVSFGNIIGCQMGWPSVYTRITAYLNFIIEATDIQKYD